MDIIKNLMKPVEPYNKFIEEIACAYKESQKRGWEFFVPAVCWMQGESDIAEYPDYDYKEFFHRMYSDLNTDIKKVTHQEENIRIICYQSSAITKGSRYQENNYRATEPRTPTAQMELVRDDTLVWASGPTYPYDFVREALHIDANGQKGVGILAAESALGILRKQPRNIGLVPLSYELVGSEVRIVYHVPCPPLCFDTISVKKADHYGFNVIRKDGVDIVSDVCISEDTVKVKCTELPSDCKLRYAVNGEYLKGGRLIGPRGNLRDSQRNPHWGFMFDIEINSLN